MFWKYIKTTKENIKIGEAVGNGVAIQIERIEHDPVEIKITVCQRSPEECTNCALRFECEGSSLPGKER